MPTSLDKILPLRKEGPEAQGPAPAPVEVRVNNYTIAMSTGRPAGVAVPVDMSEKEWLDLIAIILTQIRPENIRRMGGNPTVEIMVPKHDLMVPGR